jgi:DNA-binding NarL/FixJ family response regulator
VRTSGAHLPLPELEDSTLVEALSRLVDTTAEELGLSSRVSFSGVDEQGKPEVAAHLSTQAEHLLFLLVQETLFQVREHQHARRLRLTFGYGHDEVRLVIEDDGVPASNIASKDGGAANENILPFAQDTRENTAFSNQVYDDLRARFTYIGGSLTREITLRGTRVEVRAPYQLPELESTTSRIEFQPLQARAKLENQEAHPQRTSVLIVDGQPVVRAGLHRLLDAYPDLLLVGEASDGVHAVSETLELGPQVVLLDAQLPEGQSLEALRQIKQLNLNTHVLLLSTEEREDYLYETLRAGADGYLLKDVTPDDLAEAIRIVARGEVLVQQQLAGRILARVGRERERGARGETLTARELEVLRLLARGLRNKEIAAHLFVSERTVNFHLANIYQKLNVSGRTEALSKALAQGLIET